MRLVVLLLLALESVGIVFNVRMLWSCFRDKAKHTILQRCRLLFIFQFIYEVTIIAIDASKVWKILDGHRETENCSVNNVLSGSIIFLTIFNIIAILMTTSDHAVVYQEIQLSPNLLLSALLCFGVIVSAMIYWYMCIPAEVVLGLPPSLSSWQRFLSYSMPVGGALQCLTLPAAQARRARGGVVRTLKEF